MMYFVIPTINGEIFGDPYITFSLDYNFKEEVTIYKIKYDYSVEEVKLENDEESIFKIIKEDNYGK